MNAAMTHLTKLCRQQPLNVMFSTVKSFTSLNPTVISQGTMDVVHQFAAKKMTGVSLKYMLDFGLNPIERQKLTSAQFLHRELPVRLAHRVKELEKLPYGLSSNKHIQTVRSWYVDSFQDILRLPEPKTFEDDLKFTDVLRGIYEKHYHVVPLMAKGIYELRRQLSNEVGLYQLPEIHRFLDEFYMSRIGIRFLIGQHLSIHNLLEDHYIGLINTRCSPVEVCREAVNDAQSVCQQKFGSCPRVDIFGDEKFTFAYVPAHIHHMVFELVKNSLRAVEDRYSELPSATPAVRVVVADGAEDVTIKVSDEGGGIPRSGLPQIWTYLYSTATSPLVHTLDDGSQAPTVLAGYGYGLPLSRLYARYFGGDLQIISMEGYGTDAYLHLNRLGNVQEPLP